MNDPCAHDKPQPSVTGAAGEHLVLSHLLKRNLIAGKTPDFTKAYDLVVLSTDGQRSAPVQVKSTFGNAWVMGKKHEEAIKGLAYCFVQFHMSASHSEVYIVPAEIVAAFVSMSHSIWLKVPGKDGRRHQDSPMRKFERNFSSHRFLSQPDLDEYIDDRDRDFIAKHGKGWLGPYLFAWDHILDGLHQG